ncbi:MAG: anti-sigma factor domain-containing protein [Bryobacteraceae bacterium]
MRIAELREKFKALRNLQLPRDSSNAPRWWIVALGTAILVILVCGTWYAGRQSASIQDRGLSSALDQMTQQLVSLKLQLDGERAKRQDAERALKSAGKSGIIDQQMQMRQQISKLQAAVGQYKAIIDRQESALDDNLSLLSALSTPAARLFLMKNSEAAAHCTAYALIVEHSKLVLIASNLPKLDKQRQLQCWIMRKKEPKIVSAGVVSPNEENHAVLEFEEPSLVSDISLVEVTNEPRGGSSEPTGPKFLFVSPENPAAR